MSDPPEVRSQTWDSSLRAKGMNSRRLRKAQRTRFPALRDDTAIEDGAAVVGLYQECQTENVGCSGGSQLPLWAISAREAAETPVARPTRIRVMVSEW